MVRTVIQIIAIVLLVHTVAMAQGNYEEVAKKADEGDIKAMVELANMLLEGKVIQRSYGEAFKLYMRADEKGSAEAACNIGGMYEKGLGVKHDNFEAIKWYRKSAEMGYARCE